LTESDLSFPPPNSALPALLALRETHQIITTSKTSIKAQIAKLSEVSQRLQKEEADLRDARLITDALEKRIERLQGQFQKQKSSRQFAEELIADQRDMGKALEKDMQKLTKALSRFIDNDLAVMMAAEEAGGPTAGDARDVDEDAVEEGYTKRGRPKKSKRTRSSVGNDTEKTQLTFRGKTGNAEGGKSKIEAAAAEMSTLLETLLEATSNETGSSGYINLDRESVVSRFLVRAKVAQFHPRDAQRIRLVEFGREVNN
jgi:DNA repair exonuclease SbcCD ATPase subunit